MPQHTANPVIYRKTAAYFATCLLNILYLFAHLLDQHFEVDRRLGAARIEGLGAQCIGFAVEFLHQEIKAPTGGAAGLANGLFGGGGGMVLAPALTGWCHMEQKRALATCVAAILPLCLLSTAISLWRQPLDWMQARSDGPLWIGVWSGNEKARRLYAAHGFEKAGEYDYPVGAWMDREFILRREANHQPREKS